MYTQGIRWPSRAANSSGQMVLTTFTICAMSYSDRSTVSKDSFYSSNRNGGLKRSNNLSSPSFLTSNYTQYKHISCWTLKFSSTIHSLQNMGFEFKIRSICNKVLIQFLTLFPKYIWPQSLLSKSCPSNFLRNCSVVWTMIYEMLLERHIV